MHWNKYWIILRWRDNMNYQQFAGILNKFSKRAIIKLLGDKIYDSIKEWTDAEEAHTQSSLVDILISINGFNLFKNKEFREIFFECLELSDLQKLLRTDSTNYEQLAKRAAKNDFVQSEFYTILFSEILGCPDYQFDEIEILNKLDEQNG